MSCHDVVARRKHLPAGKERRVRHNLPRWSLMDEKNELPRWQKRGIGVLWEMYEKAATIPLTGEAVVAIRRRVRVEFNFLMKDECSACIHELNQRELSVSM